MLYSFFFLLFSFFSAFFCSSSFINLSGKSLEFTSILVREMTKFYLISHHSFVKKGISNLRHQKFLIMDLRVIKHFQHFTQSLKDIELNMSLSLTFKENHGYKSSFHSRNLQFGQKNMNKEVPNTYYLVEWMNIPSIYFSTAY